MAKRVRGMVGAVLVAAAVLATPTPARAQAPPAPGPLPPPLGGPVEPYGADDAGGFRNVLPPGSNGLTNAADFAAYQGGQYPPHSNDALAPYRDLVFESPSVGSGGIQNFFKDGTFGIQPGNVEGPVENPRKSQNPPACPGATVLRDKDFGVPRVYAGSREAAMCALGYIAAEDRLFLIDVLRHAGRAELTTLIGGAEANQEMDEEQWRIAPYSEGDLQRQLAQLPELYGDEGQQILDDVNDYVNGINGYILEAKANAIKMPVEYAAINMPQGPDPWRATDLVATASLVGGIFGKGGGRELDAALMLQKMQKQFPEGADDDRETQEGEGREVFDDFRRAEDEEAPTTVRESFPYQRPPGGNFEPESSGVPDPGSVDKAETSVFDPSCQPDQECNPTPLPGAPVLPNLGGVLSGFPSGASNALLVSGSNTDSGTPQTVFGPQTGYFSPQILMEQEVHAPTLEARGASFPGVNLYVQLGRGRDFAWSATSAGQDITDTYAVELCDEGDGYMFRGDCEPIEDLDKTNVFNTNASDTTVGAQQLRTQRTKLGLIVGRGKIDDDDVAYTQLRSTYFHEIDSARGFSDFNDPGKIGGLGDYQRAAHKIGYTFNWFYTDSEKIGYFNSGNNPVRPEGIDHNFPVRGLEEYEWRGLDPDDYTARYTPFGQHPRPTTRAS